ncbi:MAG: hypothetical protein ACMUIL_08430 [bacterium]
MAKQVPVDRFDDALEIVRTGLQQGMCHQRNREIPGIYVYY